MWKGEHGWTWSWAHEEERENLGKYIQGTSALQENTSLLVCHSQDVEGMSFNASVDGENTAYWLWYLLKKSRVKKQDWVSTQCVPP